MISLSGLNNNQRKAAETIDGPVLILAGAGSGKTRTITYRIAHMVANLGIKAESILGVSFTNKAAKEMQERVIGLLGAKKTQGITLSTFHSLGVKILKEEITKLGYHKNFSIYDSSDQLALIRQALKQYRADQKFDYKIILSKIGKLKNLGVSEDHFANSLHFNEDDPYDIATEYVYRYYQDQLKFYNAIDFDDILFLTVKLLAQHPEIASKYSKKFRYIMIDEYQDTNPLQFQLILSLTSEHNNLCVVGDDDQSIYSFRGADIKNILSFEKHFPGAKVVKLEENYRSTMPILHLANQVIAENKERREKTLWSQTPSENKPLLWIMGDTEHEAQVVIDDIIKHQGNEGSLNDIAILYRSNTQTPPLEEQLRMNQIPYTVLGGQKFYEKKEVKDLMAYLCVLLNPHDQISLRRILNVPHRGIGHTTLRKYLTEAETKMCSLFKALEQNPGLDPQRAGKISQFIHLIRKYQQAFKTKPLPQVITEFIEEIDYFRFVEKQHDSAKQVDRRKNDVIQFVESADRFQMHNDIGYNTLKDFVEKLFLQDSQDTKEDEAGKKKNEVTLMTLHSSKGLEFDIVYLIGTEEETLPHKRTIKMGEDISEERRLCYVGITRARKKLVMTYCKERTIYGRKTPRHISRFLLPFKEKDHFIEQDRTKFGHLSDQEAKQYKKDFFANLIDGLGD